MMALDVSTRFSEYRNNIEMLSFTFSYYNFFSADLDFYPTMVYSFIVTYAFMGLELVCIEMDDPFGNDANDLNVASLVEKVFKDITMCIEDVDGDENADLLKKYVTVMDTLEKSEENRTFHDFSKSMSVHWNKASLSERSNLLQKATSKHLPSMDTTMSSSVGSYSGYQP